MTVVLQRPPLEKQLLLVVWYHQVPAVLSARADPLSVELRARPYHFFGGTFGYLLWRILRQIIFVPVRFVDKKPICR